MKKAGRGNRYRSVRWRLSRSKAYAQLRTISTSVLSNPSHFYANHFAPTYSTSRGREFSALRMVHQKRRIVVARIVGMYASVQILYFVYPERSLD